jgi:hypothetical protein
MTHEFLSIYPAKLLEYGLAVLYLLLFLPFWAYVQGGRREARVAERRPVETPRTVPARRAAPVGAALPVHARRRTRVHVVRARAVRAGARRTGEG